jgi:class 3 adenylate cyclase
MPEERKLVTVLFADIVGSTAIGASRDPEVVRVARRTKRSCLAWPQESAS